MMLISARDTKNNKQKRKATKNKDRKELRGDVSHGGRVKSK